MYILQRPFQIVYLYTIGKLNLYGISKLTRFILRFVYAYIILQITVYTEHSRWIHFKSRIR